MPALRDGPSGARSRRRPFPSLLLRVLLLPLLAAGAAAACGEPAEEGAEESPEAGPEWEELAPVLEARTEVSVAADGERIYLAGGFLAPPEGHPEDERPPAARRLLAYDPAADAWSEEGEVPVGTHHAGMLGVDGLLYLVGGYDGNSFEPRDGTVWIYDPAAGEWEELPPMPTARHGVGAAVLDGAIYVVSGGPEPGFNYGTANERLRP